ncbi:hypothetical protein IAR55_001167 [Kwoniella newhampshirensis]|uniref:Velvet domain-containing protein n=1 Tax=Kwoniella newhampshirensis TaxID=1651941 RepID=A0AAW0Z5M9_9TREE
MPLEVTPAPFAASQRLPYTPAVIRPHNGLSPSSASSIGPGGGGSDGASFGPGPLVGAGSTMIPPAPGGIAGPHRPIAALPEAGYTAPGFRLAGLSAGSRYSGSFYSPSEGGEAGGHYAPAPRSVYSSIAPSAYDLNPATPPPHHHHHQETEIQHHQPFVHSPLSVVQSDNHFSNSLPSPRRGPPIAHAESIQDLHHHHHRGEIDDIDARSDAIYYALPKKNNHGARSRSGSTSSVSDTGTSAEDIHPQPQHHRSRSISSQTRDHHHGHQNHRSPSLPPVGRNHSPIPPSPLAAGADGSPAATSPSKRFPLRQHGHGRTSPGPAANTDMDDNKRSRLRSYLPLGREDEKGHGSDGDDARARRYSLPRSRSHSHSHSHTLPVENVEQLRRHNSNSSHRAHHHCSTPPPQAQPPIEGPVHDGHDHPHRHHQFPQTLQPLPQPHIHDGHHHHRHRSGSHPPLPGPTPEWNVNRSSSTMGLAPVPPYTMQDDGLGVYRPRRRRAISMQGLKGPQPQPQPQPHHPFNVNVNVDGTVYDDEASVAESRKTFLDGSMAGRASQYGLPKYPYPQKEDYRRYCIQRGKADVFIG